MVITKEYQQLLNYSVQKIEMKKLANTQNEIMKMNLLDKLNLKEKEIKE